MIYILKAWSHRDGETTVFCFSSDEKRKSFMEELQSDARERDDSEYWWNNNWETEDLPFDPEPELGK